tara:strand:+ start:459 stop:1586 length:1128 start_codon:yes stop_codon:yes gene_type:complete
MQERISNLDFIRGIAVLGILIMNSRIFAMPKSAYNNISTAGAENFIDWSILIFSQLFIAEKFMGLFSILFGASIALFIHAAKIKERKNPRLLSLWRNFLLLIFGGVHAFFYVGDVLTVYASCALIVIIIYNRSIKILIFFGVLLTCFGAIIAPLFQILFDDQGNLISSAKESFTDGKGLTGYWFDNSKEMGEAIGLFWGLDVICRALGMMLLGVVLYRLSILQGKKEKVFYKKLVIIFLPMGIILTSINIIWLSVENYHPSIAIISSTPLKLAIIPMCLSYIGLLSIMNMNLPEKLAIYIRSCGKMAFTNYITQTVLCFIFIKGIFQNYNFSILETFIFIMFVWALQLFWSKFWLEKFRYGPLEWLWRKLTYINS